jgi:hypothetical protein
MIERSLNIFTLGTTLAAVFAELGDLSFGK